MLILYPIILIIYIYILYFICIYLKKSSLIPPPTHTHTHPLNPNPSPNQVLYLSRLLQTPSPLPLPSPTLPPFENTVLSTLSFLPPKTQETTLLQIIEDVTTEYITSTEPTIEEELEPFKSITTSYRPPGGDLSSTSRPSPPPRTRYVPQLLSLLPTFSPSSPYHSYVLNLCAEHPLTFGVQACYALEAMLGRAGKEVRHSVL